MKTPQTFSPRLRGCLLLLGAITLPSLSTVAQTTTVPHPTRRAVSNQTGEATGVLDRLFSRPVRRDTAAQSQRVRQAYAAARSTTRYYNPPASTYIPTQPPAPAVTITSRSVPAGTRVIYQNNAVQPSVNASNSRYLQPGDSATISPTGTVFRTESGQTITSIPRTPAPGTDIMPVTEPKPAAPPKALIDKESLPVAKRSEIYGRVVSPYPPHHELDVNGLPPGSLARDPVSRLIFRLP